MITPNLALTSNDLFLDIFKISLGSFGSNSCYILFNVLQCILYGFSCCTLLPIREKGIGIVSYLASKLSSFVYDQKMSTSGSSVRNSHLSQGGRMTMMPTELELPLVVIL